MASPRLARVGVLSWDLPLARPLVVGGVKLARRAGLLVVVEDGEGHAGIGETAPLPGLHAESAVEAAAQLLAQAMELEGERVPAHCEALDGAFEAWLGGRNLYPSVRTGIEGAALSLLADRAGKDVAHLLAEDPAPRVRANGLLDGDAATVLKGARLLAQSGYSALKIKVGRGDPGAEAELVAAVRAAVGPTIALRLDANRRWRLAAALEFAAHVAPAGVEYLEEPLRDSGDLEAFAAAASVPVALDESLRSFTPEAPPALRGVAALILKPTVLGGYERSRAWARLAERAGLATVVSAAFPAAVGMALDVALAASLGGDTAHGLGTADAFAADLARAPLAIGGGRIDARRLPLRPRDFDLRAARVLR